jgi:hypothetical protein
MEEIEAEILANVSWGHETRRRLKRMVREDTHQGGGWLVPFWKIPLNTEHHIVIRGCICPIVGYNFHKHQYSSLS